MVSLAVVPGGSQSQFLTHRPKTQQADPELPLYPFGPLRFQAALDRVADVRGHMLEIRKAVLVFRDAVSVIDNPQIRCPLLFATSDRDLVSTGIDAVFDEFCDSLQRIALGERNDRDGIPMIADT